MTVLSLLLLCLLLPAVSAAELTQVREVHYQMGTFLELTLWDRDPERARRLIREAVQEVHRLDDLLSNYNPESALSRFNDLAGKGPRRVPPDLFDLLETARAMSEKTAGLFDVTVGALMDLWNKAAQAHRLPSQDSLKSSLATVGYRNLVLHGINRAEIKQRRTRLDLGGIGKGFAVDHVAAMFRARRVSAALINFGGSSMAAIGAPPAKRGWEVAVQGPDGRLRGDLYLRNAALSTSGSMGRWWNIEGKKYGHLVNPLSGYPVTINRVVTAVAAKATEAEALTKPLALLGNEATTMIEKFSGAAAMVIPEFDAISFSRNFRATVSWKDFLQR